MGKLEDKIIIFFLSKVPTELLKIEMSKRNYGVIKGDLFSWLFSWLKAYDKQNNSKTGEIIINWINNSPMGAG